MGWGVSAKVRNALLEPCLRYASPQKKAMFDFPAYAICVDGNAALRSGCCGATPPVLVVRRFLDSVGFPAYTPRICVAFDNCNIPPARAQVHIDRAKRKTPAATHSQINACTTRSLGTTTWQSLFANTTGKRKAYDLLYSALTTEIKARGPSNLDSAQTDIVASVSKPYSNSVWSYPFNTPCEFNLASYVPYGEAEAQIVLCTERLVSAGCGPIIIATIDTDILLQTMGIFARSVYIYLANVWKVTPKKRKRDAPDEVYYRTAKTAKAATVPGDKIEKVAEFVSCNAMRKHLGPSAIDMANSMLWMLLSGGVDYNAGLGRFGWFTTTCIDQRKHMVIEELSIERTVINIAKLFDRLHIVRDRRPKKYTASELVAELHSTFYCLAYYLWYDDARQGAAGPRVANCLPPPPDGVTIESYMKTCRPKTIAILNAYPTGNTFTPPAKQQAAYALYAAKGVCR